jgi:uncharacterized protein Smg (DUF494 family)
VKATKKNKKILFLDPPLFKKNTQWKVDQDYIQILKKQASAGSKEAIEALEWLSKFNNEYYNSTFSKNDNNNLIKGRAAKKEVYSMRNSENRDLYSNKSNLGLIDSILEDKVLNRVADEGDGT